MNAVKDEVVKPQEEYQWDGNAEITITGKEFEILHNTLAAIFQTDIPIAHMYVMLHGSYQVTTNALKRNIENGIIKPKEAEEIKEPSY